MHKRLHLVEPRHGVGVSAKGDHHHRGGQRSKVGNELVLSEREVIVFAVAVLTVLPVVFVHAAYIYNKVCLPSLLDSLIVQSLLFGGVDGIPLVVDGTSGGVTLGEGKPHPRAPLERGE